MGAGKIADTAADVAPPISASGAQNAAATATTYGVFRIATTAASQRFALPLKWKGRWWSIRAVGLDVQLLFGSSTVSVTLNAVSTVASEAITLNAASGITIPAGEKEPFYVPGSDDVTHFAFISSGTSGYVEICPSSNPTPANIKG